MKSTPSCNTALRTSAFVVLGAVAGCSTHPDALRIDRVGVELVASNRYIAAREAGEKALAVVFSGHAPFAAIVRGDRMPQFECELRDGADKPVSEDDSGSMYFESTDMKADPATGLAELDSGETYRYRAVLFYGLKWRTTVNGPADLDLLRSNYDHIACRLRGARMFGAVWMSNDIAISKREVLELADRESPPR